MSPLSQCRSQNALPPDASTSRLQSPQPPAPANPSYTACPSHPPESSGEKESAFAVQGNPLRLVFLGTGSRTFWTSALALALTTQVPPQPVKVVLGVPKPMKLYSANADQFGANIHSTLAPTVRPVPSFEASPSCASEPSKKVVFVLVHAAPPCA